MRVVAVLLVFTLSGCAVQWSLGPSAWSTTPPVIPGFTPVPLGNGGFIEEPNSALPGATPPATPEQTTLGALEEAQRTREAVRKLAR